MVSVRHKLSLESEERRVDVVNAKDRSGRRQAGASMADRPRQAEAARKTKEMIALTGRQARSQVGKDRRTGSPLMMCCW